MQFDEDCVRQFGSLQAADDALANFLFDIARGVAPGSVVINGTGVYISSSGRRLAVLVEVAGLRVILKALVAVELAEQQAA
jgi:hypothetical protein